MGNRISGRSLQDDAFGAEESVDRRSRVMGDDFAEHFDDGSNDPHAEEEDNEPETEADPTEDPVRMYLMQMGQIPLLTRDQEIAAAKQIERTRDKYRHCMLATDFMLQGSLKLLQQVRD
ncbi:MAG: sigma-70 factor domain-containing protein, partial [Planctomycetota bacterium]